MTREELVYAVINHVVPGLKQTAMLSVSEQQIEAEIIVERLALIKKYSIKGMLDLKTVIHEIPCIELDCDSLDRCCNLEFTHLDKVRHFTIPPLALVYKGNPVMYAGTIDNMEEYKVYIDESFRNHRRQKFISQRPYIWINVTPNKDGWFDGYLINAPKVKWLTIRALWNDPSDLRDFTCCSPEQYDNYDFFTKEIQEVLINRYLQTHRQIQTPVAPNDNKPRP